MCLTEYNEELVMDALREDSRKEGEQNLITIYNWLKNEGRHEDAEAIMQPDNADLRQKIMKGYLDNGSYQKLQGAFCD